MKELSVGNRFSGVDGTTKFPASFAGEVLTDSTSLHEGNCATLGIEVLQDRRLAEWMN
jgi:hypothetical protein